ncbi:MAG: response regulator, partial [Spirochaetae bacterium HGW-Spirochaetae-6]
MSRILVIDDEKNVHYSFKRVFKDLEIISAFSAEEALALLGKDKQFALIISDIKMQGMSGLDLLDELKKQ